MAAALERRAIPAHDFSESWRNTEIAFDQEEQIQSFLDGELVTHDRRSTCCATLSIV